MIQIIDTTGRTVGYVRNGDSDDRVRRMIDGARDYARRNPNGTPVLDDIRAGRARRAKRLRVAGYVFAALAVFWIIGKVTGPNDSTATAPVPAAPVASTVAPAGVPAPVSVSAPSVVAAMTPPRAADSATLADTDPNGVVSVGGQKIDSVYRIGSPLRAQYLAAFADRGMPIGIESAAIREGVAFCADVARGSVVALRERADVLSAVPNFDTGNRRVVVASAALATFCPKYL
ncbi:membrane protein [Rhodococcus phage MacGully]|nr:membrane protein [Rhodococcus phage MacGully]